MLIANALYTNSPNINAIQWFHAVVHILTAAYRLCVAVGRPMLVTWISSGQSPQIVSVKGCSELVQPDPGFGGVEDGHWRAWCQHANCLELSWWCCSQTPVHCRSVVCVELQNRGIVAAWEPLQRNLLFCSRVGRQSWTWTSGQCSEVSTCYSHQAGASCPWGQSKCKEEIFRVTTYYSQRSVIVHNKKNLPAILTKSLLRWWASRVPLTPGAGEVDSSNREMWTWSPHSLEFQSTCSKSRSSRT